MDKKIIINFFNNLGFDAIQTSETDLDYFFWPAEEMEKLNADYEVEQYLPNYFGVGSSGGGELFAVDLSTGIFYSIPFIPMDSTERIKVADSIEELIKMKK